jgi:hypothetical protein
VMRMAFEDSWQVSIAELNSYLRRAGVEPMSRDGAVSARDLDLLTRVALVEALHRSVRCARESAPPVDKWLAADVLRHTVDPTHELDTPHLIRRAEDW